MSASAAKAGRREIRRAFGEDACQTIEAHEFGLRAHALLLNELHGEVKSLAASVAELRAYIVSLQPRAEGEAS